jgi:hypothetical protein
MVGPGGTPAQGFVVAPDGQQRAAGILLGRIGENGKVFVIGERYQGTPNQEGTLYLLIAPSPWNNASTGSYKVKIGAGE